MTRRSAKVLLAVSLAVLLGAAVMLASAGDDEPRADLEGASVTVPTSRPAPKPTVAAAPASTTATVPAPGFPQRLRIPALGVDAPVIPVGLEDDGSMQIPGATESGWFWPGVRPGSTNGSAVIAAHVDYAGQRGVFFDLRTLEVGSEVAVTDDQGMSLQYVVTERYQVGKADLPVDELFRTGGSEILTLITCGGAFDAAARSYADNIVVRAEPV